MRGHIHQRRRARRDGATSTTFYVVMDGERRPDGRRRQEWHGGFSTLAAAERTRAELVQQRGMTRSRRASPPTSLSDWVLGRWLPSISGRLKASTFHSYRRNLELHVLPSLGAGELPELNAQMLNELYQRLSAVGGPRGPLAPKTVHYIHMTIHKALADAVDADVVPHNVASRAKPPLPSRTAVTAARVWDVHELARFLSHVAGSPLEAVWRLTAMTGMRRGEILGLRWADVDLAHLRVSVCRAHVLVDGEVMLTSPKGGAARVIDIDEQTGVLLESHRVRQQREGAGSAAPSTLVGLGPTGEPLNPDAFSRLFKKLSREAGLRPIRLHDVRHSHATALLSRGVPVKVVSERLGHASPAFTLAVYAHVIPGMQGEAAARLAELVDDAARKP